MTDLVIGQEFQIGYCSKLVKNEYRAMTNQSEPRFPPEMLPENIGKRMKLLREAFDLQPSEIADMIGIERTYWTRFEKGHRPISDIAAYLLVDRFGITLDWLILGRWDKLPLDVANKLRSAAAR